MASAARRLWFPFAKRPQFLTVCRIAKLYGTRPSKLLDARDAYTAYCIDEAGAWLLGQKDPPRYGGQKATVNNPKLLAALAQMGGAAIKGTTDYG